MIPVPPGTQVTGIDGSVFDLVEPGQKAVVAHGGTGGHGNRRFATSTRQAPRFAEKGLPGEEGTIELRLKLLADVGLVGMPNAGKSSLLARMTRAAPKVAEYPFTTLEPVLGTLERDDSQLVLADIPGLIEGAAGGAGLGHEFLAHVERCRMLVHVVDLAPMDETDPAVAYEAVRAELEAYGAGLERLPELVALNKRDLMPEEQWRQIVDDWSERVGERTLGVLGVSAATGAGVDELAGAIFGSYVEVAAAEPEPSLAAAPSGFAAEHRVYRPGGETGYRVSREDGAFRVEGAGIELLLQRFDLSNEEALSHVERRLHEIGVVKALRDAGFTDGDDLRIGDAEFEFYPER